MPDQNDHDLLITLHEKVQNLITQVSRLTDDHEQRIRSLERWVWRAIGALTIVDLIIGYYLLYRSH